VGNRDRNGAAQNFFVKRRRLSDAPDTEWSGSATELSMMAAGGSE